VVIYKFGVYLYDNMLLFAPHVEEFATLDVAGVAAFVEAVRPVPLSDMKPPEPRRSTARAPGTTKL
jgi:hypothetical protein